MRQLDRQIVCQHLRAEGSQQRKKHEELRQERSFFWFDVDLADVQERGVVDTVVVVDDGVAVAEVQPPAANLEVKKIDLT